MSTPAKKPTPEFAVLKGLAIGLAVAGVVAASIAIAGIAIPVALTITLAVVGKSQNSKI